MSYQMKMRNLAKSFAVGAALAAANLFAHAQSGPATLAVPSSNLELSAKSEAGVKSLPETESIAEPSAQTSPSIDEFVAKLDSATRAIHESSKKDITLVREGCRTLLSKILDLDAMARAANAEIWEKMTPPQR